MPKGVEHIDPNRTRRVDWRVPTSVMPKGVEHHLMRDEEYMSYYGADLCDAERR